MADAGGDLGGGVQRHGLDHQIAALPVADGVPVEGRVRVVGVPASIRVDAADLAVRLDGDGHPAGRIDELHRIGPAHDHRHPRRHAVRVAVLKAFAHRRIGLGLGLGGELRLRLGRSTGGLPVDVPNPFVEVRQRRDLRKFRSAIVRRLRGRDHLGRGGDHRNGGGQAGARKTRTHERLPRRPGRVFALDPV